MRSFKNGFSLNELNNVTRILTNHKVQYIAVQQQLNKMHLLHMPVSILAL